MLFILFHITKLTNVLGFNNFFKVTFECVLGYVPRKSVQPFENYIKIKIILFSNRGFQHF